MHCVRKLGWVERPHFAASDDLSYLYDQNYESAFTLVIILIFGLVWTPYLP
jgi:hypothetical protein